MPTATDRGPAALRDIPIPTGGDADVVAQSIGVPPGGTPSPSPPEPGPRPHPAATVPVQLSPSIEVHRVSVMIDYYESIRDADGDPLFSERVVRTIDTNGRLLERIVQDPVVKVTTKYAYIADGADRLATLEDGSLAGIPEGPGLPGHYGRPKDTGGGDRHRTMHR